MTKYEKLPDDILIDLVKSGDRDAEEYLLIKYLPLIKSETRFLFLVGAETEDLSQEGMIGLFLAIRDYDKNKDSSFHTFATICVRNRIHAAISAAKRKKHFPLNNAVSLYYSEGDEDEKDIVSDDNVTNPENIILRQEKIEQMYEKMNMKLSTTEKNVTKLYLEGLSRKEIAERLGKNEKSVDNALNRVHNKLKE